MTIELKNYMYQSGGTKFHQANKTVLVDDSGRTKLKVLMMDGQLTVMSVPKEEARFMSAPLGKTKAMSSVIRQFASYGHKNGTTKAAKSFLKKARAA